MNEELISRLNECLQICKRLGVKQAEAGELIHTGVGGELQELYEEALLVSNYKIAKLENRICELIEAASAEG